MALTVYQNETGRNKTFQFLQKDATTPVPLNSSMTVTWRLKSINTLTSLVALTCVITDFNNAKFYATITTGLTATTDEYMAQIEISQGGTLLFYSEPFSVIVSKNMAVSG